MPPKAESSKLSVRQFAEQYRGEMISLSDSISYYCAASEALTEEDLKEYLQEPIAALPPSVSAALPKLSILLVPYLEREKDAPKSAAKARRSRASMSPKNGRLRVGSRPPHS